MSSTAIFFHNTFTKYPDPCAKAMAYCFSEYKKRNGVANYAFKCTDKYEKCIGKKINKK